MTDPSQTDATAVVPTTDVADETDDRGPSPAGRWRLTQLGLWRAVAAVLAVATLVLATLALGDSGSGEAEDLRETAGRFGEALVSYDYHDPDAHRDAVLELATGAFREEYEAAFERGLGQIITEVQAVTRGYVKDIYLSAIDGGQAQAVVVVDIEHEGTGGGNQLYDVYFRLTLIELGGRWLVDDVTDLSFGTGSTGGSSGSPTTTTVPGSTTTPVP